MKRLPVLLFRQSDWLIKCGLFLMNSWLINTGWLTELAEWLVGWLAYDLFACYICWMTDITVTGLVTDWLAYLSDWLAGCDTFLLTAGWLAGRPTAGLLAKQIAGWLVLKISEWLTDWLNDRLIRLMTFWLADGFHDHDHNIIMNVEFS